MKKGRGEERKKERKKERKRERGREGGRKEERKEGRRRKEEKEKKVKRKGSVASRSQQLGPWHQQPSSCYFTPVTPLPPLARAQLNVDFKASESTRLISYVINCQRHGWPYGTEKASSHSYFCM